jgi:hypothetical protein
MPRSVEATIPANNLAQFGVSLHMQGSRLYQIWKVLGPAVRLRDYSKLQREKLQDFFCTIGSNTYMLQTIGQGHSSPCDQTTALICEWQISVPSVTLHLAADRRNGLLTYI